MELPQDDQLATVELGNVFDHTTNSYKFYWLLAILDELQATGSPRLSLRQLSLRMVARAWYPLDYFKLSFGKQDGFRTIAHLVTQHMQVDNLPSAPDLFVQLAQALDTQAQEQIYKRVAVLLDWVPCRFIRPFFALETHRLPDQQVNARLTELAAQSTRAPYYFVPGAIHLHSAWLAYFQRHQSVLRGFIQWHLVRFLQKHNPTVIGLSEKLEKPADRILTTARKFWKDYLQATPGLTCIYSGRPLTTSDLSLDHFLPWSYVAHDQLWNIIPTLKAVNSAKSDWLPSVELYLEPYAQLQYAGFQFHANQSHDKLLEDYNTLFAQSLPTLQQQPFEWFRDQLQRQILPQLQTARNLGFAYPFEYRTR